MSDIKRESVRDAYTLLQINDLPEVKGTGYVLEHKKTKARISIVSNDEENKVFTIGFRTPPTNSKGIQHIIEHTVLCGSDKYPAKDPFIELAKGSLNTFLNAMTFPDKTLYPIASCNDKDFRNLMDVYLDAVFNPNIGKKIEIFRQEGWHYEMTSPEDALTINGVVYNEMRGAYSAPESVVACAINKNMFPDSIYSLDSGGEPYTIPTLTYEEYLDCYSKYYHPSNSYIYLYGDMDWEEKLEYIDREYLSKYDYLYVPSEIKEQTPFTEPVSATEYYSISEAEDEEGKAFLTYNVVLPAMTNDKFTLAGLSMIDYVLMDMPGAPLKDAIIKAGIGSDVESQLDTSILQPIYTIMAREASAGDEEKLTRLIEDKLAEICATGINKVSLRAAINHFEFIHREANSGRIPKGLSLGISAFNTWLYDDKRVHDLFSRNDVFEFLKDKLDTDYFEELIRKYILNNSFKGFIRVLPEKNMNKKKDDELAAWLAEYKASLSVDEIQDIIDSTASLKAYQSEPSTPEEIAAIPCLERSDLKKEVRVFSTSRGVVSGLPVVSSKLFTNGISYTTIVFDVKDFTEDEIYTLAFLTDILGDMDTTGHTLAELSTAIDIDTGGVSFSCGVTNNNRGNEGDFRVTASVRLSSFDDKLMDGFRLIREVLMDTKLDDKARIREIVSEIKASAAMGIVSSGHTSSMGRALSFINAGAKLKNMMSGIDYYDYIVRLDTDFDNRIDELTAKLSRVRDKLLRRSGVIVSFASNEEPTTLEEPLRYFSELLSDEPVADPDWVTARSEWQELLSYSFPEMPETAVGRIFPEGAHSEAIKCSTKVQYNAVAADFRAAGLSYDSTLNVLKTIMSYDYLWNNVRVLGGAYGSMCDFNPNGTLSFTSYRDPNMLETLEVYRKAADYVESFDCSDRDMTKYLIGTMSTLDTPLSPMAEASVAFSQYMAGISEEERQKNRDTVLAVSQESIRALAPFIRLLSDGKAICVIGDENKIEDSANSFDSIRRL